MDGGGRGWGKGEEKPEGEAFWKTKYPLILPLISCVPLHFRKWAGNQSKWVKLKTESTLYWLKKKTHVEPISETVRWSFFSRQYLLHGHKYELIFAALYIFLSIAAVIYLTVLLPSEGCIRRFTHHNLFDTNRHTLVKWCGWLFSFFLFIHSEERKFSQGAK